MTFEKRKKNKKITKSRLQNIALYYIERFSATEHTLRRVLLLRIAKSNIDNPEQLESIHKENIEKWLEEVVETAKKLGYINDEVFATRSVEKLLKKGISIKGIVLKLQEKGVNKIIINKAIENLNAKNDLESAKKYAKKRRFGKKFLSENEDLEIIKKMQTKQLSALARRGFSYSISIKALEFFESDLKEY